jgi:PKD repeat protein
VLDFGAVATGMTAQASFTVTNNGASTLNGSAAITNGGPFAVFSGSPFTLDAQGSTNVVIAFTPSVTGSITNSVIFTSDEGDSTNRVTGTGAVPPTASFTANPTNGLVPLTVVFNDTSLGTITNRFWNFGNGVTTNVNVTSVTNRYNATGTNTVTLIVRGPVGASTNTVPGLIIVTNLPPPQLAISPTNRNYGTVVMGQTNTQPFSVINLGGQALTGTASVGGPFAISGSNMFNVPAGQTGMVNVSFIPVASGTASNRVVFTSNGGTSSNAVTGFGLLPGALAVGPPSLDFGSIATGATAQANFVLTNTGGTAVNGTATIPSGPFTVLNGTPFNLSGNGSTNLVVNFMPLAHGPVTNTAIFLSDGGNSTNTLLGRGVAFPPGDVNGDGKVTGSDSLLIHQVLVGLRSNSHSVFAAAGFGNGDVNTNVAVINADSLLINQVLGGVRSYIATTILPLSHSSNQTTAVTIFGIGFPTNGPPPTVKIESPVDLMLTNVVLSRERITATVPPGGGLGTGTVPVTFPSVNGVISFGRFGNQ